MDRREFVKTTAASTVFSALPLLSALGKTTKYRTALVGTGWWGMNILREAMQAGESKVVALCDVDRNYLLPASEEVTKLNGDKPKLYGDYRELLAKRSRRL